RSDPVSPSFPPKGGGFYPGSTGQWGTASPIADPFALIPAPLVPADPQPPTDADVAGNLTCNTSAKVKAGNCKVAHLIHGCPDTICTLFTAGHYNSGITVANFTALFDPGVYYLQGGLRLKQNSVVRPGTGVRDGRGGTLYYL